MKLLLRYSTLSTLYYVACLLSLLLFTYLSMRSIERNSEPMAGTRTLSVLSMLVCVASVLRLYWVKGYRFFCPTTTAWLYLAFLLWVFVPTLMHNVGDGSLSDTIFVLTEQVMPISTLMITYNHLLNHGEQRWMKWFFCAMSVVYAIGYVQVFLSMQSIGAAIQMIISYYTLYMLPLILLTNGRKMSILAVFFTFLLLTTSVKRGGLVAIAGGLLVYCLVYFFTTRKRSIGMIIGSIVIGGMLVGGFIYVGTAGDTNIIERFQNIGSDDGSGRLTVWARSYKMIEQSDAAALLAGHGYDKVVEDSPLDKSAHNDFLEITYDYGLVGLLLYLAAGVSLFCYVVRLILRRSPSAAAMAMFFVIYFVLSMISHIIIYPWASLIMLTISYVFAKEKLDARCKAQGG